MTDLGAEAEERLLAELMHEFPAFRVVSKQGDRLSTVIDRALRLLSFGKQRRYLTEYRTVLGDTLYVPASWYATAPVDRLICLRHERVHLRQRRRYGTVGMAILYLFVPFPVGLAWFRARMEWEAYAETLRATSEWYGIEAVTHPSMREHIVERFAGPDYLWMWPFRAAVSRWYDDVANEIARGA